MISYKYRLRCELQMMLTEPKIPILILCCSQYNSNDPNAEYFDLNQFAAEMHLTQITENRQSHYIKVGQGAIFMEQNMRFWAGWRKKNGQVCYF